MGRWLLGSCRSSSPRSPSRSPSPSMSGVPGSGSPPARWSRSAIVYVAVRDRPRGAIGEASAGEPGRLLVVVSRAVEDAAAIARDRRPRSAAREPSRRAEVLVLSPARIGFLDRWASDLEGARREAQRNLVITVASLAKAGVAAEARVGDEDLVQAVEDTVALLRGDRGDPGHRRRRPRPSRGGGGDGAGGEAAGAVPAARPQRSSSSLKRSAARVGVSSSSSPCSRPAPPRSRTARSIASRSAKPGSLAGHLADQFGQGQPGGVQLEQEPQHRGLGRRVALPGAAMSLGPSMPF